MSSHSWNYLHKTPFTTIYSWNNYLQLFITIYKVNFVNNNEQKPYLHIWKPLIGKIIFSDIVCLIFWKTSNVKAFFPNVTWPVST